jgi:hypothetical protein
VQLRAAVGWLLVQLRAAVGWLLVQLRAAVGCRAAANASSQAERALHAINLT